MTEIIGDHVWPSELILPHLISGAVVGVTQPMISGAIMLSGGKIVFYTGSAYEEVSSS